MNGKTNAENNVRVYNLGEGRTFDISGIPGYQKLTVDNFLVVPSKITTTVKVRQAAYGEYHTTSNSVTINKSYNADTGILTVSGCGVSVSDPSVQASASASVGNIRVYLVKGYIR